MGKPGADVYEDLGGIIRVQNLSAVGPDELHTVANPSLVRRPLKDDSALEAGVLPHLLGHLLEFVPVLRPPPCSPPPQLAAPRKAAPASPAPPTLRKSLRESPLGLDLLRPIRFSLLYPSSHSWAGSFFIFHSRTGPAITLR